MNGEGIWCPSLVTSTLITATLFLLVIPSLPFVLFSVYETILLVVTNLKVAKNITQIFRDVHSLPIKLCSHFQIFLIQCKIFIAFILFILLLLSSCWKNHALSLIILFLSSRLSLSSRIGNWVFSVISPKLWKALSSSIHLYLSASSFKKSNPLKSNFLNCISMALFSKKNDYHILSYITFSFPSNKQVL